MNNKKEGKKKRKKKEKISGKKMNKIRKWD